MNDESSLPITDEDLEVVRYDVVELYGYDFTNYSQGIVRQEDSQADRETGLQFCRVQVQASADKTYFKRFVEEITVNVTEMSVIRVSTGPCAKKCCRCLRRIP